MQSSDLLLYPSISVCSINNGIAYVAGGKIFESTRSYATFLETNITTPYAFEPGHGPNLTEILHSIVFEDVNGTKHELSPSNDGRENRETQFVNSI